jgi:hypothetical protein
MKKSFKALCASAVLGMAASVAHAGDMVLINIDPPNVGFNDTTPATPVGGNPGTTVGEQRIIAYSRALQLWGSVLKSDVPISVLGSFAPLACTATGGTLAQAGAWNGEVSFTGAPVMNTIYPSALANSIAGTDLYAGTDIVDGADILARFNGNLGAPGCIEGSTWYYGLDSNAPNTQTDFLNVFMHELAHGLGFANWVNEGTGARTAGLNDIYMTFQKDNFTGKTWGNMTAAEIVAAAVRDGQMVWVGPNVTARAPSVLDPVLMLGVTAPVGVAGQYDFLGGASFGSIPTSAAFTGDVVAALAAGTGLAVNEGCTAFTNAAAVAGKVAIVRRGTCGFAVKAKNAQLAGAKAVIIANNALATGPMGMGGTDATVTIPAIAVGTDNGTALINVGAFTSAGFVPHPTRIAGLAASGHIRLYAPTTVALGSTASHFDVVAEPSLLMEPFNTPLLEASHNVDLTLALFEDIGWKTEISLAGCGAGSGTRGASLTGEIYAGPIFICADNAAVKGDFQSCTARHLGDLNRAGVISGALKGVLGVCAANGKSK